MDTLPPRSLFDWSCSWIWAHWGLVITEHIPSLANWDFLLIMAQKKMVERSNINLSIAVLLVVPKNCKGVHNGNVSKRNMARLRPRNVSKK